MTFLSFSQCPGSSGPDLVWGGWVRGEAGHSPCTSLPPGPCPNSPCSWRPLWPLPKIEPPVTLCLDPALVVVNFCSKHNYQPILNMDGYFSKIKIGLITLNKMEKQRKCLTLNERLCFRWLKWEEEEIYRSHILSSLFTWGIKINSVDTWVTWVNQTNPSLSLLSKQYHSITEGGLNKLVAVLVWARARKKGPKDLIEIRYHRKKLVCSSWLAGTFDFLSQT